MNKFRRNGSEAKKLLDCRLPSPESVLEHSRFGESCNSSDTADSISTGGKSCDPIFFHSSSFSPRTEMKLRKSSHL